MPLREGTQLGGDETQAGAGASGMGERARDTSEAPPMPTRRDELAFLAWLALVILALTVMAGLLAWRIWPR